MKIESILIVDQSAVIELRKSTSVMCLSGTSSFLMEYQFYLKDELTAKL